MSEYHIFLILLIPIFIIGVLLGFIIAKKQTPRNKDIYYQYKKEVNNYINNTVNLLNTVSKNYKDIQTHLSGLQDLLSFDEYSKKLLNKNKYIEAPKDYEADPLKNKYDVYD